METKKYSSKISYSGKWCLLKQTAISSYESIFVYAICDGIMKYCSEHNPKHICYEDVSQVKGYWNFFINPIQAARPDFIGSEMSEYQNDFDEKDWKRSFNGGLDPYLNPGTDKIDPLSLCDHEWFETVYTSNPPIYSRTCKKCGKQEHLKDDKRVTGAY